MIWFRTFDDYPAGAKGILGRDGYGKPLSLGDAVENV